MVTFHILRDVKTIAPVSVSDDGTAVDVITKALQSHAGEPDVVAHGLRVLARLVRLCPSPLSLPHVSHFFAHASCTLLASVVGLKLRATSWLCGVRWCFFFSCASPNSPCFMCPPFA